MRFQRACAALSVVAIVATAGSAWAQSSIDLQGTAPLVCRASLTESSASSSQVTELCNDPSGFSLYLDYPSSLAGSTVTVNGVAEVLPATGEIEIAQSSHPFTGEEDLTITPAPATAVTLTARMVPTDASAYAVASTN